MKTVFCDIDGTIVKHHGLGLSAQVSMDPEILPGVIEKFNKWQSLGYTIILVTGRTSSMREETEAQLKSLGIFWNKLIMDLPNGPRVIVNDLKPNVRIKDSDLDSSKLTALGMVVERNSGLEEVKI